MRLQAGGKAIGCRRRRVAVYLLNAPSREGLGHLADDITADLYIIYASYG